MRARIAIQIVVWVCGSASLFAQATGSPLRTIIDDPDATVRRTDGCGADPGCGPAPLLNDVPDLRLVRLGTWLPGQPENDLFQGTFANTGPFLRLDLVFDGVVGPAGPMATAYDPGRYTVVPLVGFVEFDVDTNALSGGNLDAPLLRYNGNAGRFGGLPVGRYFLNRVSPDGRDADNDYNTPPWIDRSGQDFELDFRGDEITAVIPRVGDNDARFEWGEVWDVRGRFFRRAQGYDACAGGAYEPVVTLRFAHQTPGNTPEQESATGHTTVSFVYPLTQLAFAAALDEPPEPIDGFDFNANSIEEALALLAATAGSNLCPAGYPYRALLSPWENQDPLAYLVPQRWRVTALVGTARSSATTGTGNYVWSDLWPNVRAGDSNGDGFLTRTDARLVQQYIEGRDGLAGYDADGLKDGVVTVPNFGLWFSLFDVNYDGLVDAADAAVAQQAPGDFENDRDVDLADFQAFQLCFDESAAAVMPSLRCRDGFDLDENNRIDSADFALFAAVLTGPAGGAP